MATRPSPAILSAPLLKLTTLATKPSVEIDGVKYGLLVPDALSLMDCARLSILMTRIDTLSPSLQAGTLTPEEEATLAEAFDLICRMVVAAPEAVQVALTALQRLSIYQAFLELPQTTLQLVGAKALGATAATRSTGGRPLPGSRGSTAASGRTSGSTGSRAASSGRTS